MVVGGKTTSDDIVFKMVKINKGPCKGFLGQVVDATATHFKVQVFAKNKKIHIEREKVGVMDDEEWTWKIETGKSPQLVRTIGGAGPGAAPNPASISTSKAEPPVLENKNIVVETEARAGAVASSVRAGEGAAKNSVVEGPTSIAGASASTGFEAVVVEKIGTRFDHRSRFTPTMVDVCVDNISENG